MKKSFSLFPAAAILLAIAVAPKPMNAACTLTANAGGNDSTQVCTNTVARNRVYSFANVADVFIKRNYSASSNATVVAEDDIENTSVKSGAGPSIESEDTIIVNDTAMIEEEDPNGNGGGNDVLVVSDDDVVQVANSSDTENETVVGGNTLLNYVEEDDAHATNDVATISGDDIEGTIVEAGAGASVKRTNNRFLNRILFYRGPDASVILGL